MEFSESMRKETIQNLIPDSRNANKGTQRGASLIQKSLQELGAGRSILVDKDNHVIAGNKTLEAAAAIGLENVRVVETDGTELVVVKRMDVKLDSKRGRELAIADNRTSQVGLEWDAGILAEFIEEDIPVKDWFSPDELSHIFDNYEVGDVEKFEAQTDEDDVPESAPKRCELGDLWQLGRHRLLCGDSTVRSNVDRLFDGVKCQITFTSPPYNAGSNELGNNRHLKSSRYISNNDNDNHYGDLLKSFTSLCIDNSEVVIVNIQMLSGNKIDFIHYLSYFAENLIDIAVWVKPATAPAMANCVMNSSFEFLLFFKRKEKTPVNRTIHTSSFRGTVSNVYTGVGVKHNEYSHVHGATFPAHLPKWIMESFSKDNGSIFDPFLGSGTTLIVAEEMDRTCYGIELNPVYCDIVLQRWEDYTGQKAVKCQ